MGFNILLRFSLVLLIATCFSATTQGKVYPISDLKQLIVKEIPINGGAVGPESFAFDGEGGGPYTGVSDGRIIKWVGNESRWIDFAVTTPNRYGCEGFYDHSLTEQRCGRPLGLSFDKNTGDLYIADAYMGLLKVGPKGGLATSLVKEAQGGPLVFTNSLAIHPTSGIVYFTDSSSRFTRRNAPSVILTGDNTGRLLKFDPSTNRVTVLLDKLMFANGVAFGKNGQFLLIAETTNRRVLKYWLTPSKAGQVEVFAELPGSPDNIQRNTKGEFWVGVSSNKGRFLKWMHTFDWPEKSLNKIPVNDTGLSLEDRAGSGLGIKLSAKGEILEILGDLNQARWPSVSEVQERNGVLWIGSVVMPYAIKQIISTPLAKS